MNEKLDDVLKQALAPDRHPDRKLNQNILCRAKELEMMKGKKKKWMPAVVCSILLVLTAGTGIAYAAYKWMTPEQAAEVVGDWKLSEAFSGEEAERVYETQHFPEYDVTLLGITSGENLSAYLVEKDGEVIKDRTYIVTAIAATDGEGMPENLSDPFYDDMRFFISPLIQGGKPELVNSFSLDTTYTEFVRDGILYRLTECNNLQRFADRTVYLCVCDGDFYNAEAYVFDENTGKINRQEGYGGVNALFELPLDPACADPDAADAFLSSLVRRTDCTEQNGQREDVEAFVEKITPETIEQYAVRIEESVHVFGADEDEVRYSYEPEEGEAIFRLLIRERDFPDGKEGMSERISYVNDEQGVEALRFYTATLNHDGTVTCAVYMPRETEME